MAANAPPERDRAEREAAEWFARLNTLSVSSQALQDFQDWRRTPANDAAFERMEELWDLGGRLKASAHAQRLVDAALRRPARRSGARRLARPAVIGLAAFAAAAALAVSFALTPGDRYTTTVGEQRLVTLDDGTRLRLDTNTAVRVRLGAARRDVDLIRGQAFFDVARDATRPFVVRADGTSVRAVGTQFDVRRAGDMVKVTLVEGVVEVSHAKAAKTWRLQPGEALASDPSAIAAPRKIDIAAATSWTAGRLVFRRTPLAEAVAEVNRYSRRKVVVDAPRLQTVPVSGVFDVGDTEAFVVAVGDLFELRAQPSGDEIRLVPAS